MILMDGNSIARQITTTRFAPDSNANDYADMLASFIAHGLTQDEAEAEVMIAIVAGTDSAASLMRSTILFVLSHPRVLARLRAEVASTVPTLRLDEVVPDAKARGMVYLQAVVKEGMRIYPPGAGALMMRDVGRGGDVHKGVVLPAGTSVGVNVWSMMRRKDVFGEDADVFRPERWLEAGDKLKRERMEGVVELTFGYGQWGCLGRNIAVMEVGKVLVEVSARCATVGHGDLG